MNLNYKEEAQLFKFKEYMSAVKERVDVINSLSGTNMPLDEMMKWRELLADFIKVNKMFTGIAEERVTQISGILAARNKIHELMQNLLSSS